MYTRHACLSSSVRSGVASSAASWPGSLSLLAGMAGAGAGAGPALLKGLAMVPSVRLLTADCCVVTLSCTNQYPDPAIM